MSKIIENGGSIVRLADSRARSDLLSRSESKLYVGDYESVEEPENAPNEEFDH